MSDRDRNEWGRAENARPRDRAGRPLPYDTDEVELAVDHSDEYDTVEGALAVGHALWNDERFFEAHECLEDVWHHAPEEDAAFWQGVIQVAVACVHHQRGNVPGVVATCRKVERRLADYPDVHHGIDVEALRIFCQGVCAAVTDADACIEVGYPELPVMDDGPWFTRDEPPTPLTREPPWRTAAADRRSAT